MNKTISVTCPGCNDVLIVDRNSGDILEVRKPLVEESSGDRMQDAFTKLSDEKRKRNALFDNMKEDQEKRKKEAESLFDVSLKSAAKTKPERTDNIFDLD